MQPTEILKEIMKRSGTSQRTLARRMGIPPQTLNGRLNSKNGMTIDCYVAALDALGYDMKIVPAADARAEFTAVPKDGGDA